MRLVEVSPVDGIENCLCLVIEVTAADCAFDNDKNWVVSDAHYVDGHRPPRVDS